MHLRRKTLDEPGSDPKWVGFAPQAYSLDGQVLLALPLKEVRVAAGGQQELIATRLGDIFYSQLANRSINDVTDHTALEGEKLLEGQKFTTDIGELVVGGAPFNLQLLKLLVDFQRDGINWVQTTFFWYDHDDDNPVGYDVYSFFVVHNSHIVRERVSFLRDSNGLRQTGFTPSVFVADDQDADDWSFTNQQWRDAKLRFWYRRFYLETTTGQLMVLRPDRPKLHHFPEGHWRPDVAFAALQQKLSSIRIALGILILAAALDLYLRWH
jgi:hypothetical protein